MAELGLRREFARECLTKDDSEMCQMLPLFSLYILPGHEPFCRLSSLPQMERKINITVSYFEHIRRR